MKKEDKPYYRIITERLPQGFGIVTLCVALLVTTFAFLSLYALVTYAKYVDISDQRLKDTNSLSYWEEVAKKQVDSPDVYYEAALYAAKVGDRQKALSYTQKALEIDPEFKKARNLEKQLTNDN